MDKLYLCYYQFYKQNFFVYHFFIKKWIILLRLDNIFSSLSFSIIIIINFTLNIYLFTRNYCNSLDSFEKPSIWTNLIKDDSKFPLRAIVRNLPLGGYLFLTSNMALMNCQLMQNTIKAMVYSDFDLTREQTVLT